MRHCILQCVWFLDHICSLTYRKQLLISFINADSEMRLDEIDFWPVEVVLLAFQVALSLNRDGKTYMYVNVINGNTGQENAGVSFNFCIILGN